MAMSVDVHKEYLKSKIRVGSIHSKLNYDQLEKVFHSDDIPQKIKDRVDAVNCMKQNHEAQSSFSTSTYLLKAENAHTIPHKYTLNPIQKQALLSETKNCTKYKSALSQAKTLKKSLSLSNLYYTDADIHWGTTDLRDLYSYNNICIAEDIKKWDYSNVFENVIDNTSFPQNYKQLNTKTYINPTQREQQRIYLMRKHKDQNRKNYLKMLEQEKIERRLAQSYQKTKLKLKSLSSEDKENITSNIKNEIDGKYNKEMLKKYLDCIDKDNVKFRSGSTINQRLIELMMNKRNNMYTTRQLLKIQERRKYDIVRDYYHNGIFQNELGGWSCCMNENKNSQGCQVRLINTAKWQTIGV